MFYGILIETDSQLKFCRSVVSLFIEALLLYWKSCVTNRNVEFTCNWCLLMWIPSVVWSILVYCS